MSGVRFSAGKPCSSNKRGHPFLMPALSPVPLNADDRIVIVLCGGKCYGGRGGAETSDASHL